MSSFEEWKNTSTNFLQGWQNPIEWVVETASSFVHILPPTGQAYFFVSNSTDVPEYVDVIHTTSMLSVFHAVIIAVIFSLPIILYSLNAETTSCDSEDVSERIEYRSTNLNTVSCLSFTVLIMTVLVLYAKSHEAANFFNNLELHDLARSLWNEPMEFYSKIINNNFQLGDILCRLVLLWLIHSNKFTLFMKTRLLKILYASYPVHVCDNYYANDNIMITVSSLVDLFKFATTYWFLWWPVYACCKSYAGCIFAALFAVFHFEILTVYNGMNVLFCVSTWTRTYATNALVAQAFGAGIAAAERRHTKRTRGLGV